MQNALLIPGGTLTFIPGVIGNQREQNYLMGTQKAEEIQIERLLLKMTLSHPSLKRPFGANTSVEHAPESTHRLVCTLTLCMCMLIHVLQQVYDRKHAHATVFSDQHTPFLQHYCIPVWYSNVHHNITYVSPLMPQLPLNSGNPLY